MIIQWEITPINLEEFFKRVRKLQIDNEKNRIQILRDLAKEGKIKSISTTKRSKKQLLKDKAKQYGRILYLGVQDYDEIS